MLKTVGISSLTTLLLNVAIPVQADMSIEKAQRLKNRMEKLLERMTLVAEEMGPELAFAAPAGTEIEPGSGYYIDEIDNTRRAKAPLTACEKLPAFHLFGVDDQMQSDSQLFVLDLVDPSDGGTEVGPLHKEYDLEGLDETFGKAGCVWVSSGDNDGGFQNGGSIGREPGFSCETGCLYPTDKSTGDVFTLPAMGVLPARGGDICDVNTGHDYKEVDVLAFQPNTPNILWGWAQSDGLIKFNHTGHPFTHSPFRTTTCEQGHKGVGATLQCTWNVEAVNEPTQNKYNDEVVEDMTWDNAGKFLYVSVDQMIAKMDPLSCTGQFICIAPYEIEALEVLPNSVVPQEPGKKEEWLAIGFHRPDGKPSTGAIAAIDVNDPTEKTGLRCKLLGIVEYPEQRDVEGLAHAFN